MKGRIGACAVIAGLLWVAAVPAGAQPGPSLAANPASGPAPLSVTFTVSPAPSPDSAIDFGDGSAASQLRRGQVTHVYQTNGRFEARLSSGSDVVGRTTISVGQ